MFEVAVLLKKSCSSFKKSFYELQSNAKLSKEKEEMVVKTNES